MPPTQGESRLRSRGKSAVSRTFAAPDKPGDPALKADGEAAVGRHPVLEGRRGSTRTARGPRRGWRARRIVRVAVQPLAAGDKLQPPEEQVEAGREARSRRVGMGVERPLAHRVAGTKRKSEPCTRRPLAQPALVAGARSGSPAEILAGLRVIIACASGEVDRRDLLRDHRQGQAQQPSAAPPRSRDRREHPGDGVRSTAMTVRWFSMKPRLCVERDVLVEVAGGVVRLGAEHRADLEDALEDADHRLLVELRALRQVGGLAEVVEGEDVRAALGGRADDLRRLDLHEAESLQSSTETRHRGGRRARSARGGADGGAPPGRCRAWSAAAP